MKRFVPVVLLAAACGETSVLGVETSDAGVPPDAGDSGSAMVPDAAACDSRCSSDGRAVLDCTGSLVTTCPEEQACAQGSGEASGDAGASNAGARCVPACNAAAAKRGLAGCEFSVGLPDRSNGDGQTITRDCLAVFLTNVGKADARFALWTGKGREYTVSYPASPKGLAEVARQTEPRLAPGESRVAFVSLSGSQCELYESVVVSVVDNPNPEAGGAFGVSGAPTGTERIAVKSTQPLRVALFGFDASLPLATAVLPTATTSTRHRFLFPSSQGSEQGSSFGVAPHVAAGVTVLSPVDILGFGPNRPLTTGPLDGTWSLIWKLSAEDPSGATSTMGLPAAFYVGSRGSAAGGRTFASFTALPGEADWGSEYVVVPHAKDPSAPAAHVRLLGLARGARLEYLPSAPAGAPESILPGQVVDLDADFPFVVRSKNDVPFAALQERKDQAAHAFFYPAATHAFEAGEIPFFVPPTAEEAYVDVVRSKTSPPLVGLDCLGEIRGFSTVGGYEIARLTLRAGNKDAGSCGGGGHMLWATGPVGVTVWSKQFGLASAYQPARSFAAPAGAAQ